MMKIVIDQTASEIRLLRVLYLVKFLRAMVLNLMFGLVALLLSVTLDIHYLHFAIDDLSASLEAVIDLLKHAGYSHAYLFVSLVGLSVFIALSTFFVWVYLSITKVWRRSLRLQTAILLIFLVSTMIPGLDHRWNFLLFSFKNLNPTFAILVALQFSLEIVVLVDMAIALWGVSRSPETSSFTATLDPRLAAGMWMYLNKFLDLPRTPFRSWQTVVAYALSFIGTIILINAIMYLISLGNMHGRSVQLLFVCEGATIAQCAVQSAIWAQNTLLWLALSLFGVRIGALLQSVAKRLGGLSVSSVLKSSDERFLLYLRPFDADDVILPKPRLPLLSMLLSFRPFPARVEEELFDVADGFRPLIAAGKPSGMHSMKGGAAYRAYLDDTDWQAYILDKICHADSIVILLKDTDGVRWELSKILSEGAASKTLFLFDPVAKNARSWQVLAERMLLPFKAAGLVAQNFTFRGRPIGFAFRHGELVEIQNANWTAHSYRTAFSYFLAELQLPYLLEENGVGAAHST